MAIAQLYRDRCEAENVFDAPQESGGLNRPHHSRVINARELMARITALIYNWWSVFTRLAIPNRHTEATNSRPLLLHGIARQTRHANQTTATITSNHANAPAVGLALEAVSTLLQRLAQTAEQLNLQQCWRQLLRLIVRDWLKTQAPGPCFLSLTMLPNWRI